MAFKFTKFCVSPSTLLGSYDISWFGVGNGLFSFDIDWSLNESGPWSTLKTVVNVAETTVNFKDRLLSNTDPIWFRVVAKEGGKVQDISVPSFYNNSLNKRDFLRYREMLRRWNLELKKFSGVSGLLLRLKTFGETADNVHPILGSPIGTEDESGLGKKFKGGYWPAIEMYVAYADAPQITPKQLSVEETGITEPDSVLFFTMPFPVIKPQDIWIASATNYRYEVRKVEEIEFRTMTIKQQVLASRLPVTDPAHKIKI
jgi:hypothetical protein